MTTFGQACERRDALDRQVTRAAAELKTFDCHKSPIGLTPDHIKALPTYRAARFAFDQAFANLRQFNMGFVKTFAKEIRAQRDARRTSTV